MRGSWEKIMREGARLLIHEKPPARMEHIILVRMRELQNRNLIPHWRNYEKTRHWKIVQRYLNKEECFLYRCTYMRLFKATWPAPTP